MLESEPSKLGYINGMLGESYAMAWLIERGYEVFVGFGNTSCDFVAIKDGDMARVEVKYATLRPGKKPNICLNGADGSTFDLLLVVLSDGSILVNPTSEQVNGVKILHRLALVDGASQ